MDTLISPESNTKPVLARFTDGSTIDFPKPGQKEQSVWALSKQKTPEEKVTLEFNTKPQIGMAFEIPGFGFYETAEPLSKEYNTKYSGDVFLNRITEAEFQAKDINSKIESRFLPIPYSIKTALGLT